jgi:hypothetical protein
MNEEDAKQKLKELQEKLNVVLEECGINQDELAFTEDNAKKLVDSLLESRKSKAIEVLSFELEKVPKFVNFDQVEGRAEEDPRHLVLLTTPGSDLDLYFRREGYRISYVSDIPSISRPQLSSIVFDEASVYKVVAKDGWTAPKLKGFDPTQFKSKKSRRK